VGSRQHSREGAALMLFKQPIEADFNPFLFLLNPFKTRITFD
jgi:hypothetical protein